MVASPLINILTYVVLGFMIGWEYTAVVFGLWLLLMFCQKTASDFTRKYQMLQSKCNDERLKIVNDLIVGCRTIKCYGWEKHYIDRI